MGNRKFINQFPSSIKSPVSSPNDYTTHLFNNIILQFNDEWIYFIPNLFHSLISAISNFFHSILSWLMVIPNFFLSLISSLFNLFHSLLMIIPNLFHSLVSKLSAIPDFFHSLFSNITSLFHSLLMIIPNFIHSLVSKLSVIPDLFHSLVSKLSVIPDLLHSLVSKLSSVIPDLLHSLVSKLSSVIPDLFHSLVSKTNNLYHSMVLVTTNLFHCLVLHLSQIPDLFHDLIYKMTKLLNSLLAKLDETCPPETREHIIKVGTPYVIAGLGVALLCLICYYCQSAIISCITWLVNAVKKLVVGLFELLKDICIKVWNICSGSAGNATKMMKGPGTGGTVMIARALFQSNPAAYFTNLRAAGAIKAPLLS